MYETDTNNATKNTEEEKADETELATEEGVASDDGYESSEDEQSVYNEDDIGANEQHNELLEAADEDLDDGEDYTKDCSINVHTNEDEYEDTAANKTTSD